MTTSGCHFSPGTEGPYCSVHADSCPVLHPQRKTMNALLSILKEDQLRHWDTVKWLVSGDIKAEGRSTLLALAFIAEADHNIGRWVPLWDHFDTSQRTLDHVGERIAALLDRLEQDDPAWREKSFRISPDGRCLKRDK